MHIFKQSTMPSWPILVDINPNETIVYPFTVSINKCVGNLLYATVCIPNKEKNMNVKVFNLISGVN